MTTHWSSIRGDLLSTDDTAFVTLHTATARGEIPRCIPLTASEARRLAAALTAAAAQVEAEVPGRCRCGDPIEAGEDTCAPCFVAAANARRSSVRVVGELGR